MWFGHSSRGGQPGMAVSTPLFRALVEQSVRHPALVPMTCCVLCSVAQNVCLFDPMDCSWPGSSVRGLFQARILELVAIFYSRGIFPTQGPSLRLLHLLHWQEDSLPLHHLGSAVPIAGILLNLEEPRASQWLRPVHLHSGPRRSQCPQSPW